MDMISGFRRDVDEICAPMGYYAASCGNRVRAGSDSWPLKMGAIHYPETSLNNCHATPRNVPEERRSNRYENGALMEWVWQRKTNYCEKNLPQYQNSSTTNPRWTALEKVSFWAIVVVGAFMIIISDLNVEDVCVFWLEDLIFCVVWLPS
jgi:hypothetical protein